MLELNGLRLHQCRVLLLEPAATEHLHCYLRHHLFHLLNKWVGIKTCRETLVLASKHAKQNYIVSILKFISLLFFICRPLDFLLFLFLCLFYTNLFRSIRKKERPLKSNIFKGIYNFHVFLYFGIHLSHQQD